MSLLSDPNVPVPVDGVQASFVWNRAVRIFEDNNVNALEVAVNNFIQTLKAAPQAALIINISLAQASGANTRALVSYGYFSPP